ncbi:MAG: hypothetical protein U0670_01770 [Anaerolineae bacterium]
MMGNDGSHLQRLTRNPEIDAFPVWSPDGTKIVYYSTHMGNRELFVMNTDGSGQQRLTNNSQDDFYAAWSPDGSLIAYSSGIF